MYSVWQRAGTLCSFFDPSVSLSVENVSNRMGVEDYFMNKKVVLTDILLDLEADFTKLFHWNTKQLFVHVTVEYESNNNERNQIVFWDKIIRSKDNKRLSITGLKNKYNTVDIDDYLPGADANVKLYWNTVPQVGYLFDTQKGSVSVKIPKFGEKFNRV